MSFLERLTRWWRARDNAPPDEGRPEDAPDASDPDEPVVMPIEESIDLHHFAPRDIPSVVTEYLLEARKLGYREVRVIHGKGKGVQRRRVQEVLSGHPAVESFRSDGLGSTLARLRPPER